MSSTLETAHTVAAVTSVFHNAVDLTKQICKRTKKKKKGSEDVALQKLLLETLESGELQISQKYSKHLAELGQRFKVGDDLSRNAIQHVAIIMQAECLRSLQLALEYDHAKLDARKLLEDAMFYKRDVLSALDDLRSRLEPHSSQPSGQTASVFAQMVPSSPISDRPSSFVFPPSSGTPDDDESSRRMSRLFSMRSRPNKRNSTSSSTISSLVVQPNLDSLGPVKQEPVRYELAAEDVPRSRSRSPAPFSRDVKVAIPDPTTELRHPALAKQTPIVRQASTSSYASDASDQTRHSTFSDEKIPVIHEDASMLQPAPLSIRPKHNRASSTSISYPGSGVPSPTESMPYQSTPSIAPDYSPRSFWFPNNPVTAIPPTTSPPLVSTPLSLPVINRERSNSALSHSSSLSSHRESLSLSHTPSLSSNPSAAIGSQLTGRPEKKNNYWGFCKGSWTIRTEDWRKGLVTQILPTGMYGHTTVWQCKHCHFRGPLYGDKKPFVTDPNIREDAATGVRYKWMFLAKCHAKVNPAMRQVGETTGYGYGCLLCSVANVASAVYGNEAMLFKHIVEAHTEGLTEEMAVRAKCVIGRKAEKSEDFEINIP